MNDSVSIIITIYNGERFLEDTIKAVLNQTYSNIELILVDDGSKDNSYEICLKYEKIDSRVKVVRKENGGMSSGRAAGYEVAEKGNWILFFDADDIPAPNMVECLMKHKQQDLVLSCFDNKTSAEILSCPFELDDDRIIKGTGSFFLRYLQEEQDAVGVLGNLCGVLINPNYFAKSYCKLCEKRDVYPQNFLNDAYSIPRLVFGAENIIFYNSNVYHHRLSKYTDSRQLRPNALAYELLDVQAENLEFFRDNASKDAYEGMFLGYMLIILKLWYQVSEYEPDQEKAKNVLDKIEHEYDNKWPEFKQISYHKINRRLMKTAIGLFNVSHKLWKRFVGDVRYGVLYKIKS